MESLGTPAPMLLLHFHLLPHFPFPMADFLFYCLCHHICPTMVLPAFPQEPIILQCLFFKLFLSICLTDGRLHKTFNIRRLDSPAFNMQKVCFYSVSPSSIAASHNSPENDPTPWVPGDMGRKKKCPLSSFIFSTLCDCIVIFFWPHLNFAFSLM